jgi:AcrR family transcriptional regulator
MGGKDMPRTAAPAGVDRRQEILRAALEVFAERDFAEATTKAIAEKAGVTQGLIYFYFPAGKEELFSAALAQETERVLSTLDIAAEQQCADAPEIGLRRMLDRLISALEEPSDASLVRIMLKAAGCPARGGERDGTRYRPIQALGVTISDALRRYLDGQVACGTVRPVDTALAGQIMTHALMVTVVRRIRGDDALAHAPREALLDSLTDLFLYGLRSPGGASEASQHATDVLPSHGRTGKRAARQVT